MTTTKIALWNKMTWPRLGIVTFVMGGEMWNNGMLVGWGAVDDAEPLRALHTSFDMGIRFIDTADPYGAGHSEEVVGQAIRESDVARDQLIFATKVGYLSSGETRNTHGESADSDYVMGAVDALL